MKKSLKKWLVSIVLMAIIINVFSGFNSTVNADEINTETTEATEIETVITEKPKEEVPVADQKEIEQGGSEPEKETEPEVKIEESTTSPAKENELDAKTFEDNSTEEPKMGQVEVHYYFGKDLMIETITGEVGTEYNIEIKEFPGYRYLEDDELKGIYSEDTRYVILKYTNEKINIDISLHLSDNLNVDNIRPENITLKLFRNGVEVKETTLNLTYEVVYKMALEGEYDRFDENGNEYEYSMIVEGFPNEYYIDGAHLMKDFDKYLFEIKAVILQSWSIEVTNRFGESSMRFVNAKGRTYNELIIPLEVTVHLLRNGVDVDGSPFILNDENYWEKDFNDMPRLDENGNIYEYTVEIEPLEGFYPKIIRNEYPGYIYYGQIVFNIENIPVVDITATTVWDGGPEIKPDVKIQLYQVKYDKHDPDYSETKPYGAPITITDGTTSHTWENLPTGYFEGHNYEYFVEEVNVPEDYEVSYSDDKLTVTNTYIGEVPTDTEETVDVEGTKTWDDNENEAGKRPESITVNLLENGTKIDSVEVTAEDNWKYSFKDLPKTKDGEEVVYTITEDEVEGYTTNIVSHDITNTYIEENLKPEDITGETVGVEGTKTWDDNNDEAGKRPESITVNLLENGTKIDSVEVTAEDNWKYSFKDLPKTKDGEEVVYTITEDEVEGYTMNIVDYNITNTFIKEVPVDPEETRVIEGTKTWNDNKDKAGKRPKSITVNLMANGEQIESRVVTKKDDWKYTFKNLPVEKDGKKIVYTLSEDIVKDYKPSFDGANITNKYVGKVEKNKLPKTGTVALTGITALGVALVALGGYTTFKKKK